MTSARMNVFTLLLCSICTRLATGGNASSLTAEYFKFHTNLTIAPYKSLHSRSGMRCAVRCDRDGSDECEGYRYAEGNCDLYRKLNLTEVRWSSHPEAVGANTFCKFSMSLRVMGGG